MAIPIGEGVKRVPSLQDQIDELRGQVAFVSHELAELRKLIEELGGPREDAGRD